MKKIKVEASKFFEMLFILVTIVFSITIVARIGKAVKFSNDCTMHVYATEKAANA